MSRALPVLVTLLLSCEVQAQVSGSLALVSDYRYRGVSLSDGLPSAQASLAYDRTDGWYAGGFAATARMGRRQRTDLQWLGYAGYAGELGPRLDWEAGAHYARYLDHGYGYPEFYLGLASEHGGARLYYAHDYFGSRLPIAYLDLNASHAWFDRCYLFGHLGTLRRLGSALAAARRSGPDRFDLRLGLGINLGPVQWQVAWITLLGPAGGPFAFGYPAGAGAGRQTLTASVTWAW